MTETSLSRKFSQEFPDFPAADFPALPESFVDTSWRNDTCPSITSDALGLTVWIDYADVSKREHQMPAERFTVTRQEAGVEVGCESWSFADWAEVLAFVDSKRVAL